MKSTRAFFGMSAVLLSAGLWACGSSSKGTTGSTGANGGASSASSTKTSSSGATGASSGTSTTNATSTSTSAGGGSAASSGSTGTGGSIGDAGNDASVPIDPNAYYVATTGDDTNPGTLAMPFLTLAQAQKAMRASSTIKTTYVRAGKYEPPQTGGSCVWGDSSGSSIELGSADQGETWSFYPPDGYGSAILDGQSTVGNSGGSGGNGVGCAFGASQVSDVTIVGLQMQSYRYASVWAWAAPNMKVLDNEVHDMMSASNSTGGVFLAASPGATVANNYVHDVAYMGIEVIDNSTGGDQISNSTISGNVVLDACTWPAVSGGGNDQNGGDCGAIYLWSQHPTVSTNILVENNYVRDVNPASMGAGDYGSCCAQGIYLDDGTNNATVRGNVVTGIKSACFQIHGGQDNVFQGNVCDLGASGKEAILEYQNDKFTQMTGNVFEDNIVVAGSTGAGSGFVGSNTPPNPMTIKNNAYFNYVGTAVSSAGTSNAGTDANPTYVDPGISCWAPTLSGTSPVKAAPVSFPGITGGWGWPGFVIPQTGTAPSWPHGC